MNHSTWDSTHEEIHVLCVLALSSCRVTSGNMTRVHGSRGQVRKQIGNRKMLFNTRAVWFPETRRGFAGLLGHIRKLVENRKWSFCLSWRAFILVPRVGDPFGLEGPPPTPEIRDSRTRYQMWQIWLAENYRMAALRLLNKGTQCLHWRT